MSRIALNIDDVLAEDITELLEQIQHDDNPSIPTPPIEIFVPNPTATAFMIYYDSKNSHGVHSVLRARKEWGWLLRWSFLNGEETDIHIKQRIEEPKYDA